MFWFGDNLPSHCKRINDDAANITLQEMKRYDVVIFLGGISNDPMAEFAPWQNYIANAALPGYLAWLAAKAKVRRFIHGGSCSVYGRNWRVRENSETRTFTPYGISKLMAEHGTAQQGYTGMEVVNFRMGTVCGFSPRMRFDLIINTMVKDALLYRKIVVNDPTAERPILDLRDCIRAYTMAMDLELKLERKVTTVNILSENVRVIDIAKAVQSRVKARFDFEPEIEVKNITDVRSYTADGTGAKDKIGFVPEFKAVNTIDQLLARFTSIPDPESDVYYNIRMLKKLAKGLQVGSPVESHNTVE